MKYFFWLPLMAGLLLSAAAPVSAQPARLEPRNGHTQLIVDGQPFLILGGELANSSASSLEYMEPVWPRLKAAGLNTVLLPVEWDQIEPQPGRFDFSVIDGLIAQAEAHNIKIVVLWFGSWKNSMSSYVPSWVKRDTKYSRSRDDKGVAQDILSAHDPDVLEADTRALTALVGHLKQTDTNNTVIMLQIQNEIGMLPTARDHGKEAQTAWQGQVPPELMRHLQKNRETLHPVVKGLWSDNGYRASGTWAEVFGTTPAAEEVFQAWGYARFVEHQVTAAKAVYEIPYFVNAALNRDGVLPGGYPSAGPLPHLFDIWNAATPTIDFLAPDIYWPDFVTWMDRFAIPGNVLFVPEANRAGLPEAGANAMYVFGQHRAIGYSPFSIDNLPENDHLTVVYGMLDELRPLLLSGKPMRGIKARVSHEGVVDETPQTFDMGDFRITATVVDPWIGRDAQKTAAHGAIIIQTGPETFIMAGSGVTFTFAKKDGKGRAGIDQILEGNFENGAFRPQRWLNGDESHQGRHLRLVPGSWAIQQITLYTYQ